MRQIVDHGNSNAEQSNDALNAANQVFVLMTCVVDLGSHAEASKLTHRYSSLSTFVDKVALAVIPIFPTNTISLQLQRTRRRVGPPSCAC